MRCQARCAILCFLSFPLAAQDPFSGAWKLNLAKSNLPPPAPQSMSAEIQSDSNGLRIREEIVTDKGDTLKVAVDAKFDGNYYPITGSPYADEVAYRRVDSHTITGTGRKAGKVVSTEEVVLSKDGRTVKATYHFTDSAGQKAEAFAVFERK